MLSEYWAIQDRPNGFSITSSRHALPKRASPGLLEFIFLHSSCLGRDRRKSFGSR